MDDWTILPMRGGDLSAVSRIADASFVVAWGERAFSEELRRPYAVLRVLRPGFGKPICGFVHLWCVAGEAQIMNLAVAPEQRRKGYGYALLKAGLQCAREGACKSVLLEVRRSNAAAITLYEREGFVRVGVRPRYYSDNQEDALVMRCML